MKLINYSETYFYTVPGGHGIIKSGVSLFMENTR